MYTVYILQSVPSGRFYIGQTEDLLKRFAEHQRGKNRATRNRGPWKVVYTQVFDSRSGAMMREREIKDWKSAERISQLILNSENS
jgi:putative endonuclease